MARRGMNRAINAGLGMMGSQKRTMSSMGLKSAVGVPRPKMLGGVPTGRMGGYNPGIFKGPLAPPRAGGSVSGAADAARRAQRGKMVSRGVVGGAGALGLVGALRNRRGPGADKMGPGRPTGMYGF